MVGKYKFSSEDDHKGGILFVIVTSKLLKRHSKAKPKPRKWGQREGRRRGRFHIHLLLHLFS